MGFFDDDVYENLDWLSQATTPLVFSGNKILSELPKSVDVSKQAILSSLDRWRRLEIDPFIKTMIGGADTLDRWVYDLIRESYIFKGEGDMIVNPAKDIFPSIQVVKIKQSFSEKEIIACVKDKLAYIAVGEDIGRINEILDLIDYKPENGATNIRTSRSIKKKKIGICQTMNKIYANNQWQIRDADLMVSFIDWLEQYMLHGNLAALTNIIKLKIMTHKKQPIYSIKEAT